MSNRVQTPLRRAWGNLHLVEHQLREAMRLSEQPVQRVRKLIDPETDEVVTITVPGEDVESPIDTTEAVALIHFAQDVVEKLLDQPVADHRAVYGLPPRE